MQKEMLFCEPRKGGPSPDMEGGVALGRIAAHAHVTALKSTWKLCLVMPSQESWEKAPEAWPKVPVCFVMDSTRRMAAFCVFYIGAHLHSNRRHSLL